MRGLGLRKVASLLLTVCFPGCLAACARTLPAAPPAADLRVEEQHVVYRGIKLTLGSPLDEWTRAFRETPRYVDRDGGIFVWDNLGLAVTLRRTFPASDPHVAALRVFFVARDVDLWPRTAFRGAVEVVQKPNGAGETATSLRLDRAATRAGLSVPGVDHGRLGLPYLTSFTVLRFASGHGHDGALELLSVAVDPGAVKLPWEIAASPPSLPPPTVQQVH